MITQRQERLAECLRILNHADEFGIPDIYIDMVYGILEP